MKGQGNQDIMVHYMKIQPHSTETAEDLHRFKWCIDSQKEAHFSSICQLGWCCLKIKELILSSWILATGVTHSILLLFLDAWLKNKTLRRTEGKADGNCQVCTMLAPSWGEGAELLHCSYRKPWWEPDCRYNIRLNQTKTHRDLLSNDLLVTWKKKKRKYRDKNVDGIFGLCSNSVSCSHRYFQSKGMFFLFPCPLIFLHLYQERSFAFLVVTDKFCKMRDLAEDLSQPSSVGHTESWTKAGFPTTVSKENKEEEFHTVIKLILHML